jgi:hypothetical protein
MYVMEMKSSMSTSRERNIQVHQTIVRMYNYMGMELTMNIKWKKMEQHTTLK